MSQPQGISLGWGLLIIAVAIIGVPWFLWRAAEADAGAAQRRRDLQRDVQQADRDHKEYEAWARRCLKPHLDPIVAANCPVELEDMRKRWKEER